MPKITEYVLESFRPKFSSPLLVRGSFLFIADFEIPYHNASFINNVFDITKRYGIKQVVWGGDAFHMESFSPFAGADLDAEAEISEIDEYLPGFLEPFKRVYHIVGNHDQRLQRALMVKLSMEKALRLVVAPETVKLYQEKVKSSEYFWMLADHNWRLTHGRNSSPSPGASAKRYAEKYQQNIIHGHTHHQGYLHDYSGRFSAIESGCAVDIERLSYNAIRDGAGTTMVNGAVIMLDTGRTYQPILLNQFTDWSFAQWQAKKTSR